MTSSTPLIRNISDTACWVAAHRARETKRPDALFRDPYARRLAGERGEAIAQSMGARNQNDWAWVARTLLFDRFTEEVVRGGAEVVIHLAAGLDTRPYRLDLPSSLTWIEVDKEEIFAYKEPILRGEEPRCRLERAAFDLADRDARARLFERASGLGGQVAVISEGFLIYLSPQQVAELAEDLAAVSSIRHWVLDLCSPGLVRLLVNTIGQQLAQAGAPFLFGPKEGPGFFAAHGWEPLEVRSLLKTAAKARRLPWNLRLAALLPESQGSQGARPWSAVCRMQRKES